MTEREQATIAAYRVLLVCCARLSQAALNKDVVDMKLAADVSHAVCALGYQTGWQFRGVLNRFC